MIDMITNVRDFKNRIHAEWTYHVSYDKLKKMFKCDCMGWVMSKNQMCRHTKELRKFLEGCDLIETEPKAVEEDKRHT